MYRLSQSHNNVFVFLSGWLEEELRGTFCNSKNIVKPETEGYLGCGAMYNLGANFLVAQPTSKQTPPFLARNVDTGF